MRIPFLKPSLPPYYLVEKDFKEVYNSGMLSASKFTRRFEERIESIHEVKHAIAISNCSDGLISLLTLYQGGTIAIPAFTFSATWQALEWNDINVVLVDVDESGLMDPSKLWDATAQYDIDAILAVHMFGNPSHIKEYEDICSRYGLDLYFDSAHGLGSLYHGKPLGGYGRAEVFSIGTTKCLPCGEGGIITTNDDELAERMRKVIIHGHPLPTNYESNLDVEIPSMNGRTQEINSIIAYHGLDVLEENIKKRNRIADQYKEAFPDKFITEVKPGNRSSYKDFALITGKDRTEKLSIMKSLYDNYGISTKEYYYPAICDLTTLNGFKSKVLNPDDDFSQARFLSQTSLAIPIYPALTGEEVSYIITALKEIGL